MLQQLAIYITKKPTNKHQSVLVSPHRMQQKYNLYDVEMKFSSCKVKSSKKKVITVNPCLKLHDETKKFARLIYKSCTAKTYFLHGDNVKLAS